MAGSIRMCGRRFSADDAGASANDPVLIKSYVVRGLESPLFCSSTFST